MLSLSVGFATPRCLRRFELLASDAERPVQASHPQPENYMATAWSGMKFQFKHEKYSSEFGMM